MPLTFGAGRFEVRGMLGSGGAGFVYRALDRQLGREVALKVLKQASGRDLFRFKREFRALADIRHRHLVELHELHASDGEWFFTMEIVEGVSFIDWVRPGPPGDPRERTRAEIAAAPLVESKLRAALPQLVDALCALHRAGKLHRDLKPSNVLVERDGRVALLDFGLVASLAEGDPEKLAVGTPVYMSPEQASDQPLTEASDWYSVGAMLYEALAGRRPFEGASGQVMQRKQTEVPPPPKSASPDLDRLCMQLLEPTAAARPDALAILAALGAAPSTQTRRIAPSQPPIEFIGRARETDELRRALGDSRRGGVAVFVRGKSGIGKSTLVRRFLRSLGGAVIALEGRCFEREAVPFKMLDGVVDALATALVGLPAATVEALAPRDLGSLVRLFPVLRRAPAFAALAEGSPPPADLQELRRRGFAALRSVLARLARTRPVILSIDDAHWGDADSAGFLSELIHAIEPGVLVIVAHRPEDYLGIAAAVRRAPGNAGHRADVRDIDIAPLAAADAQLLLAQVSPLVAADAARATALVAAAAGNPLVLAELARAQLEAGELPAKPTQIAEVVRARAARLSPEARALLTVTSVAARPLPLAIAAHAAGLVLGGHDEASQLAAERLATLRHVEGETILHPAHDFVRAAVLGGLDPEAKAGWHEALARAFEAEASPLDSQAVVEHWLAAGHPQSAAHHAVAAAQRAEEALAFKRAAELYQIALAYGPWDTTGQRDLLRHQAHALACAGQLDEAAPIYAHAAQLVADDEAIDLERLHVEALLRRGRFAEALPIAEKLLAQIGVRMPLGRAPRSRLSTWMQSKLRSLDFVERDAAEQSPAALAAIDVLYTVASSLAFADPGLGRGAQTELLRRALDAGEPVRVCLALTQEICYAAAPGSRSRAAVEAVGAKLHAAARRAGYPHVIGLADTALGIAAHMMGDWRSSRAQLESGLSTLREHGSGVRWEIDVAEGFWLSTLYYTGAWRELAFQSQQLLREAIDRGDVVAQQTLQIVRCNLAWLLHDRPADARAALVAAERTAGDGFHATHAYLLTAAANLDLYTGDGTAAARRLEASWGKLEKSGILRTQQARIEFTLLRARANLADEQRSDRARTAHAIADQIAKEGAPWATALALLVHASAHAAEGAADEAHASLALAERPLAASELRGYLAAARVQRGRLEGGARGIARAEAALDELRDLGAADPDAVASHLVPWPARFG